MAFLEQELYTLKATVRDNSFSQDILRKSYDWLTNVPPRERTRELDKLQAEICYLLAHSLKQTNKDLAQEYAEESINLYEKLNVVSLEEAAPILWERLPDQMHEGVVKSTLRELL